MGNPLMYGAQASGTTGGGINWAGLGQGLLNSIPVIGPIAGGIFGAIGAGMNANDDRKYRNRLFDYQKQQDALQQKNTERQMGMNSLSFLRDDFKTALYRSLTRGF